MKSVKDYLGIVQFSIYLAILLLTAGVSYGLIRERLSNAELNIKELNKDHDTVVTINALISTMESDIREIKVDVKDLKKLVERHVILNK